PGRAVRRIDLHDLDLRALAAQQLGQLARLVGHATGRRRQGADEKNPISGETPSINKLEGQEEGNFSTSDAYQRPTVASQEPPQDLHYQRAQQDGDQPGKHEKEQVPGWGSSDELI